MKNIIILATGGTIAGKGELGEDFGYKSGSILAKDLIEAHPMLKNIANIQVEQICNLNSDDITSEIWIKLASRISEIENDSQIDGIVITHGTDTMEETAFFLALTVNISKPIVFTGSMRPATAQNPDGPDNLIFALKTACLESSKNAVQIAFAQKTFNALHVQKTHTTSLNAFDSFEIPNNSVIPKFNIQNRNILPSVNVLYFHADANCKQINVIANESDGLVIAGAGAGEFSKNWANEISKLNIPVVISSRINRGSVLPEQLLIPSAIASYSLPPAKASILLRLALTQTNDLNKIQEYFAAF